MDKKLNVMKCCKGKTSSTTPPCSLSLLPSLPSRAHAHTGISNTGTHIHVPYSPLPQPASPPPPDPVISSSPLRLITPSPPICHSSPALHLFFPLVSLSLAFPTGRLSVDVKEGSVVSNSPSDTGLLTFHCTLRKEGFLSLHTGVTPHRP